MKNIIEAIEAVLDKRSLNGASDNNLISWLNQLKTTWKDNRYILNCIDGFIDAIKQTPLIKWKNKMNTLTETYSELKHRQQKEVNEFEGKFFAFGDKQFKEGVESVGLTMDNFKTSIFSLGAGSYILKTKSQEFNDMFKRHKMERSEAKKAEKFLFDSLVYELNNHEYCYTQDPTQALEALGYEREDIDPKILAKAMYTANQMDN